MLRPYLGRVFLVLWNTTLRAAFRQPFSNCMSTPRLAIIGCGAIAERFHAPAIRRDKRLLAGLILVDPDPKRAEAVAGAAGGGVIARSHHDILDRVDGVIITAPHHLHAPIASDCIAAGKPVLCEKPLSGTFAEAGALVDLAAARGVPLALNNTRRLFPTHREVARLISDGTLGDLRRIEFEDGDKFDWPLTSPALFGVRGGGRGILLDIGAHVVDLVCWWLGGQPEITRYEDDALGGTEAWAGVHLRRGAATAEIRLSWLGKLKNGFVVEGDRGRVTGGIYDWRTLSLTSGGRERTITLQSRAVKYDDFARDLLANFCAVIESGAQPLVSGTDVLPGLDVIERCYAQRTRVAMPWFDAWSKVAS
jgi:predicted dehydrogenase